MFFPSYFCRWKKSAEGCEAKTSGDVGEHVENDNGGQSDAVNKALEAM